MAPKVEIKLKKMSKYCAMLLFFSGIQKEKFGRMYAAYILSHKYFSLTIYYFLLCVCMCVNYFFNITYLHLEV